MAARKKTQPAAAALGQSDPKAPLDSSALLTAATPVLRHLTEDLLQRADESPAMTTALRARHAEEQKENRTAEAYEPWRRAFVEQVAASWFLGCVFVRTLEDRSLVDRNRIAGPGALDSQRAFFALFPSLTERDYLLSVFRELTHLPAAEELFDPRHNPLWLLGPSAEAVQQLLQLFRNPSAETPSFRFGHPDTRFLGDLYQDLSEDVRKRYALLQTPAFIERFILDRTLEPAIEHFGLDEANVIDPTCGSGHFLLGAFDRLFNHRLLKEPGLAHPQAAQKALENIAGSDINPYAVAIARFRLTLSFLDKAGLTRLRGAPKVPLNVVVADSLYYNPQKQQLELGHLETTSAKAWLGAELKFEDPEAARRVLHSRYAAVVGNPPYITVKDKALRDRYRGMYPTAHREYSVAVPFKERFFQLARQKGHVGMITANSFMKREFGKKLIEEYLGTVNLQTVINTSGAFIPGHGTPTVLLFGTAEPPQDAAVLTVLASRGEPATPEDPELGLVWSSIAQHWSEIGFENEYISVTRTPRTTLCKHPWSLGGGGAAELKEMLEARAESRLEDVVDAIGFMCMTRADDIYFVPRDALRRAQIDDRYIIENVEGEVVRDWSISNPNTTLFPYDSNLEPTQSSAVHRFLWPFRTMLWLRREPNGNHREIGLTWWEWSRFMRNRYRTPLSITFAEVATHNHFVLDKGGKVFKQTAPIIKLPESATEDDHYALLAYLNSSTVCFWMKQVFMNKGGSGIGRGIQDEAWEARYQFDGTKLGSVPLAAEWRSLAPLGRAIAECVEHLQNVLPRAAIAQWSSRTGSGFPNDFGTLPRDMQQRLVALQEEVDWAVYELFGLIDSDSTKKVSKLRQSLFGTWQELDTGPVQPFPAQLEAGHRPFEQLLDQKETQWFVRNGYSLPCGYADYPKPVATLHQTRLELIKRIRELEIIEQPEYKRRWTLRSVKDEADQAVREYALAALEQSFVDSIVVQPVGDMVAAWTRKQPGHAEAVTLYHFGGDARAWAKAAVPKEAVPFLSACQFTESGIEKRAVWERTWSLQRREDAGENVGTIPVPPKYDSKDYSRPEFWSLRGKLDVPKERFISYPGCESDEDGEPVYGWAGWDHLQRAQALVALYQQRKGEGWKAERLTPMLAGMLELLPWLKQWHSEPDPNLDGARPSEQFEALLAAECSLHGLTHDDLRSWRPASRKGGAKAAKIALPVAEEHEEEEVVQEAPVKVEAKKAARKTRKKPAERDEQPGLFKTEESS